MYIVSSCLVGVNCRYNGESTFIEKIDKLVKEGKAILLCPEVLGGLEIPREPCEIITTENGNRKVISETGNDFTKEFESGAQKTLEICKTAGVKKAILQARSPSCGCGKVYSGKFDRKLIDGNGLTADLLIKNGIEVITDEEWSK